MVDLMMDCLKQDLVEEEEVQDQYEKDMKLKMDKKTKPITEEHFSKGEKATRSTYAFQAFGQVLIRPSCELSLFVQGPHACIGMRFALLEAKVALLAVCRRFQFLAGPTTQEPLNLNPTSQLGCPVGGLWTTVQRREGACS